MRHATATTTKYTYLCIAYCAFVAAEQRNLSLKAEAQAKVKQ